MLAQRRLFAGAAIALLWIGLWFVPWQEALRGLIFAKLCVALAALILPGACLAHLLSHRRVVTADLITDGFSVSLILCALFGLLAKLGHVSFANFRLLFIASGGLVLLAALLRKQPSDERAGRTGADPHFGLALILLVSAVLAALITSQRVLSEDDTIYLAYISNFQFAQALDFKEVVFGTDFASPARFWLMSIPISLALLADLSRIPAIVLVSGYYEPLLAGLAILACYRLARALGCSPELAALAGVLQLTFLVLLSDYLHPGFPFFHQLSTDKATAAFILTPVFIRNLHAWSTRGGQSNGILTMLTGLSLSFAHPVIFAFACLVALVLGVFATTRTNLRIFALPLAAILVAGGLPHLVVRFAGGASTSHYASASVMAAGDIGGMITVWGNTGLYGLNLDTLRMRFPFGSQNPGAIAGLAWLVLPFTLAAISVRQLRHNAAAQYFFAGFLLCALAWFPVTGWMMGLALTPWMLERAAWIFPFGLMSALLFQYPTDSAPRRDSSPETRPISWQPITRWLVATASLAILILYMLEHGLPAFDRLRQRTLRYQDLAQVGMYLDAQGRSTVIGSDELNDFLPAVTVDAKPISYRASDPTYSYFISDADHRQRVADRQAILSAATDMERRLELCRAYGVDFLVIRKDEWSEVEGLLARYPDQFSKALQSRYYIVIEVHAL